MSQVRVPPSNDTAPSPMHRALHVAGTIWGQYSYLFAFALVFAIGCATSEVFATAGNLRNIPHQSAAVGIVALGMALVILTGGIDLSVGSVLAVSGVLALIVLNRTGQPVLAVLAALATGATIGLVNGLLIARARIAPFIVTLGGFGAFRALARHLGATIPTEPTPTAESARAAFLAIDGGTLFGVPIPVVIFVAVAGIIFFVATRLPFGRHLYAVGSSERAALLSAIPVTRVKVLTYVICGLLTGLAAVLYAARLGSVTPSDAGAGFELEAIAAVVIGGISMAGGRGAIVGAFIGVLILGMLNNVLNLAHLTTDLREIVRGVIIVLAVLIQKREG